MKKSGKRGVETQGIHEVKTIFIKILRELFHEYTCFKTHHRFLLIEIYDSKNKLPRFN